jgi:hypothetical protein
MSVRPEVILLSALAAACIFGCAQERPTRPRNKIELLPAIPLTYDPVLESSPQVSALKQDDSTFFVALDTLIDPNEKRSWDVRIEFERRSCLEDMYARDPATGAWAPLELRSDYFGCVPEHVPAHHLLSAAGFTEGSFSELISEGLSLKSQHSRWAKAQVLILDKQYQGIHISRDIWAISLAWNGQLYVGVMTVPTRAQPRTDSLMVYSADGQYVRTASPPFSPSRMAWGPDGLWIMHGYHPMVISLCDSNGVPHGQFTYPGDKCPSDAGSIDGGLIWHRGQLLVHDRCTRKLYWINAVASLTSGQAVIADSVALSDDPGNGLATDGEKIFFFFNGLSAYSAAGQREFSLPAPYSDTGVWDGEALWLVHGGQMSAWSEDALISRFLLQ